MWCRDEVRRDPADPGPGRGVRQPAVPSATTSRTRSPTPAIRRCSCERTTKEQRADTFGGIAAPQEVVAAFENGTDEARELVEGVVRVSYGPVLDVHWVTVKQLAVLEPTLVETVACMVGGLLKEALHETVHTVGVPEAAAKAMLFGHVQVALANTLRGSNPFSDACLIAMDYGRESIVRDDWKKIFDDGELDKVITQDAADRPDRARTRVAPQTTRALHQLQCAMA